MTEIEFKPKYVCWGKTSVLENGVVIAQGSFGPRREDLSPEQWAAFEKMRDGDNSQTEEGR